MGTPAPQRPSLILTCTLILYRRSRMPSTLTICRHLADWRIRDRAMGPWWGHGDRPNCPLRRVPCDTIIMTVAAPTPTVPVTTCLTTTSGIAMNETFNQSFSATIGQNTTVFSLTMVNNIQRGNFNGTLQAQATIGNP
jgi:hypothetical protein